MTARTPERPSTAPPGVVFVGHPFTSIGKGEELRSAFAAYNTLDPNAAVYDIWGTATASADARAVIDPDHHALASDHLAESLGSGVRVFHLNGDEIGRAREVLAARGEAFGAGRNVVVPAWELPSYPKVWAEALATFDEVWAISRFVEASLATAGIAARFVGQSVELAPRPLLPRRVFGVRCSAFVFLTVLDLSSYAARKNPDGVIEFYERLRARRPIEDMVLVVKVKNADREAPEFAAALRERGGPDVVVVDRVLSTYEMHSLVGAADCFVSLHRSEGFGRGMGEAMWLGRLALATGWSGNMDFMADHPLAVRHTLVPVRPGEYPHADGQVWAEPDVDHAVTLANRLLGDPAFASAARRHGQATVRRVASRRAVGLRILERVDALLATPATAETAS